MSSINAKGTISVKNAEGKLIPFLPTVDASNVRSRNGVTLKETIAGLNRKMLVAEESGGIEIVHSEPTPELTESLSPETFIAWYKNPNTDGQKHLSVYVSNDHENEILKVGDVVTFTYVVTNDGGE